MTNAHDTGADIDCLQCGKVHSSWSNCPEPFEQDGCDSPPSEEAQTEVATEQPVQRTDIPSRPTDELKKIAQALVNGHIFTDRHCASADEVTETFMLIALGGLQLINVDTLGMIFEYMDKAGPMSVNGRPMFMSMHCLNKEDTKTVLGYARKIREATQAALED